MNSEIFNIDSFNIVEDEENYYFFRALNMADNADVEQGITTSKTGEIERIRTDRARYEGEAKYSEESKISLEEVFDHIKMHYRKDTNCISLTSNGNVAVNYGRGSYKDRYVMIRVPKVDVGERVVVAGQYMLEEISKRIGEVIEKVEEEKKSKIDTYMGEIDRAERNETLEEIIERRYSLGKGRIEEGRGKLRRGITYRRPVSQMSNYQSLGREQILEINKIYAKMAVLEREGIEEHIIEHTANSKVRETVGSAFSSMELIHYGEIKKENIIEIPKEVIDIFSLIQQMQELMPKLEYEKFEKLKRAIIDVIKNGIQIRSISEIEEDIKKNISIEEMYELTEGRVEYGKATSIVNSMYYLSKARKNAIELSNVLREIFGNNSEFEETIRYIQDNGFRVEPEVISRQSGNGIKLSESVNLRLPKEEQGLVGEIKLFLNAELDEVLKSGGLANIKQIITRTYGNESEKISRERYYAEAIISQYNWEIIGVEEFKIAERTELVQKLQERDCIKIYNELKQKGIDDRVIPIYVLNIAIRQGLYEQYTNGEIDNLLNGKNDILEKELSIGLVERFLGYYDVEGTGIKLKDYQQIAFDNVNEIFENHKYAQVILPTGAGKSFIALAQIKQYATEHPNEKILYLAPQDEILNQIKNYIVKYIHGKQGTVGKSTNEIVADLFPNMSFESYAGLLAKRGKNIVNEEYGMIVLDEMHRTGAKEWEEKIDILLENQNDSVKILGITATPIRDVDERDMSREIAKKLGFNESDIDREKYIATRITLENAIRMGYVVNPKLVYCKYDLISSGKMDELRRRIESIENEDKKREELSKYYKLIANINEEMTREIGDEARKKLEEEARTNLESGIGKEDILRKNVKKGGRYIVFIPVTDQGEIEDEDGNRIGAKTGEDKLKAYQDYLKKIFDGTDIVPQCYAMCGSWNRIGKNKFGEDRNQQELNAFELDNTDKTKFMVVMNKANEGLHIEGVDGIIWFRALDENSRILYLQQLGRVIYALDEDNPSLDEKRPIVIDLTNNTLTVKMDKYYKKIDPIDDLQALNIIVKWIDEHGGEYPNRNSSNKQERHYYAVLRKIQKRYNKYLDNLDEFEELPGEKKNEIQEIISLATQIDLWNVILPAYTSKNGNREEVNPFEISGIIRDYIEIKEKIEELEMDNAMAVFVRVCEALSKQGFQFKECGYSKTVKMPNGENRRVNKTLEDIQKEKPNIDIDEVLRETGVTLDYLFGSKHKMALDYIRSNNRPISKEQKQKLIQMGVIELNKETALTVFLRVCEALKKQGMDFSKFKYSYQMRDKDGKSILVSKTLKDIKMENPNINIEQVLNEAGVDIDYPMKRGYANAVQAFNYSPKAGSITEKQRKKLVELGIITLKKETIISVFVRVCEALKKQGFNFDTFSFAYYRMQNKREFEEARYGISSENEARSDKKKYKTFCKTMLDIQREFPSIDMERVLEETGVGLDYAIGKGYNQAVRSNRIIGRGMKTTSDKRNSYCPMTEEERKKLIDMGIIVLDNKRKSAKEKMIVNNDNTISSLLENVRQKRDEARIVNEQAKSLEQEIKQTTNQVVQTERDGF